MGASEKWHLIPRRYITMSVCRPRTVCGRVKPVKFDAPAPRRQMNLSSTVCIFPP